MVSLRLECWCSSHYLPEHSFVVTAEDGCKKSYAD